MEKEVDVYSTSLLLAREAHVAPNKLVLVPHVRDARQVSAIINCMGSLWGVMPKPMSRMAIEQASQIRTAANRRYGHVIKTPNRIWELSFEEWAVKYNDPRIKVDCAVVWSPPEVAARHALTCWRFVKPFGRLVAIVPAEHVKLVNCWVENRGGDFDTFGDQDTAEQHTFMCVTRPGDGSEGG
jgi:hypothetical protein